MKANGSLRGLAAWLRYLAAAIIVAVGIVFPLYLLAIFPDVPGWMHASRGRGWYVADALSSFWYRLAYCGFVIALATIVLADLIGAVGPRTRHRGDWR